MYTVVYHATMHDVENNLVPSSGCVHQYWIVGLGTTARMGIDCPFRVTGRDIKTHGIEYEVHWLGTRIA